jgi:hypothetical protein
MTERRRREPHSSHARPAMAAVIVTVEECEKTSVDRAQSRLARTHLRILYGARRGGLHAARACGSEKHAWARRDRASCHDAEER